MTGQPAELPELMRAAELATARAAELERSAMAPAELELPPGLEVLHDFEILLSAWRKYLEGERGSDDRYVRGVLACTAALADTIKRVVRNSGG